MKHVKKLFSVMLVLVMALAMALPVAAAEGDNQKTYSITIVNTNVGHTYEAYQIFVGDLSTNEEGESVLSNIKWGAGVSSIGQKELGDATAKAKEIVNEAAAKDFAKEVSQYLAKPTASTNTKTDDDKYVITSDQLVAGYYLVKDKDDSQTGKDDAYTSYIMKVVENVTAMPKSAVPSVEKKVQDEIADKDVNADDNGWGDTADHAINESFQFKLTAELPANVHFGAYESYMVKFTDIMSDGITYESLESVTVGSVNITEDINAYECTAVENQAGGQWELTIKDIKNIAGINLTDGVTVEVIYNAHLNENAFVNNITGTTSNVNTVILSFSNNPNGEGIGVTPEDSVWVFTYRVNNTKVVGGTIEYNDDKTIKTFTPLAGAEFRLYDSTGAAEIKLIYDEEKSAYRPTKGNEQGTEMESAVDTGVFNIIGLDAGTYILKETSTPEGYNTCPDKEIVITANHTVGENGQITVLETETTNSTMNNIIENFAGTVLPGTGGMGTTIIYIVGGILAVGAAVLLIAKKRTKM